MQTTERLRRRVDSTESLRSVVSTMKALAAMKIRQYERAVESLADYARTVELGLHVVLRAGQRPGTPDDPSMAGPPAFVVFGSDQGLCGRFNEEIVEFAAERIHPLVREREDFNLMAVGTRTAGGLARLGLRPREELSLPNSVTGVTALVEELLLRIDAWRGESGVGRVFLYYNHPVQRTRFQPLQRQLIPVDISRVRALDDEGWPTRVLPTFTMDAERLLAALVREYLFVAVFRAVAESLASEHGSRLSSMQAAERNIDERLDELQSEYRFRRQAAITEELLDVVAGFEALTGPEA